MKTTTAVMRRGLFGVLVASAAGGAVVAALVTPTAPATAAQDPCAASEVARTIGDVAMSTGDYLDEHPQTNQALTTISKQQAGPQSVAALKTYFDGNPQVAKDMQQLQQPLASLSGKCKLPFTLPQLAGLLQAAQQGGGLPASLPGQAPTGQSAGHPGAGTTAHMPVAAPVSQGTAATPGSAIAGLP